MDPEHRQHPNDAPAPDESSAAVEPSAVGQGSTAVEEPLTEASSPTSSSTLVMQPPTTPTPDAKPNWTSRLPENPLPAILGAAIVLLLGFALTQTNDRISQTNDRISGLEDKVDAGFARIDERFSAQDAKFEARFAVQDAKFEARFAALDDKFEARFAVQDDKLDEINLKLTALIAALNATAEVEAALEGRLLDPNAPPADEAAN